MRKGWEIRSLAEVCDRITQGPNPKYDTKGSGKYKVLKTKNLYDNIIHYIEADDISESVFNSLKSSELRNGDVLIAIVGQGSINKCNVFDNPTNSRYIFTRALGLVRTNSKYLYPYFLKAFLQSEEGKRIVDSGINGTSGQQVVTTTHLKSIKIPLPPLPEQKLIVAILDDAFAAIDKAKANIEKNIQNARKLFESYLNNVLENPGEDWEENTLGDIAEIEYGYTDKAVTVGDYRYIRITDIDKEGLLSYSDKVYVKGNREAKNFILNQNDLLMARTGATFAKVLLYENTEPSVFASYLIRIKFGGAIESKFYWYFAKSALYWEQANALASGAAQPQFNGNALKQVLFAYPKSLLLQRDLVQKFDAVRAETKKLEGVYHQKIADLEELRKSILQKAFSGELETKKELAI